MSKIDYNDDIMPYKKKSTAKAPKKAKHKHVCEPCVLSYSAEWWTKEHLRNGKMKDTIGAYCPICGKIGDVKDRSVWYTKDTVFIGNMQFSESVLTEEGKKQMDPKTRTLPTFVVESPFDKFVNLNESKE